MSAQENTPRTCSHSVVKLDQISIKAGICSENALTSIAITRLTAHFMTGLIVLVKSKTWVSKLSLSTRTMPTSAGLSASSSASSLRNLPASSSKMAEQHDVSLARDRRHQPYKREGQDCGQLARALQPSSNIEPYLACFYFLEKQGRRFLCQKYDHSPHDNIHLK